VFLVTFISLPCGYQFLTIFADLDAFSFRCDVKVRLAIAFDARQILSATQRDFRVNLQLELALLAGTHQRCTVIGEQLR
jgi:hypothetical protein